MTVCLSLCGSHCVTSVLPDCANSGIWGSVTWLLSWCRASSTDDCGICLFQKESGISYFAKWRAWFGGHLGSVSLKNKYPRYMMGRTGKHLHELFGEAKTGNCILQSRVAFVRENRIHRGCQLSLLDAEACCDWKRGLIRCHCFNF